MLWLSEWASCFPGTLCALNFAVFTASTWKCVSSCSWQQEITVHLGHIKNLTINLGLGKHIYVPASLPYLVGSWKTWMSFEYTTRLCIWEEDNEIMKKKVTLLTNDGSANTSSKLPSRFTRSFVFPVTRSSYLLGYNQYGREGKDRRGALTQLSQKCSAYQLSNNLNKPSIWLTCTGRLHVLKSPGI